MKVITTIEVSADCTLDDLKNYGITTEELKATYRVAFLRLLREATEGQDIQYTVDVHVVED